jgi:glycosyltransferase involved in cell wall biosynthesis
MRILYVEPFEAGSHARFTATLTGGIDAEWTKLTLPGRHWKWRMRGAAPWAALARAEDVRGPFDLVWASSFVNLAELVGLVPELARVPRILYFHENQFAYPEQAPGEAAFDVDFGYVQMVAALAADRLVFNSKWNRDSFLAGATGLLERLPDAVPPGWVERMRERATVLSIPMDLPELAPHAFVDAPDEHERRLGPIVLWNHRWEHDKAPEVFFDALTRLAEDGEPFRVAVCGQRFRSAPAVFETARAALGERVVHWGTAEKREEYERLLGRAHIAVSTARQEFFGLALLEAVWHGARPLAPDALSYPELLPAEHLYDCPGALAARLAHLCREWTQGRAPLRADRRDLVEAHRTAAVLPAYARLIDEVAAGTPH